MRRWIGAASAAFAAGVLLAGPAAALDGCHVGQKVVLPGGKPGTVTAVNGSACTVADDAGILGEAVWAAFMLESADGTDPNALPPMTSIPPGTYKCHHTGGYAFVDVVIVDEDTYEDRGGVAGDYTIDAEGKIDFYSGPFIDHPAYADKGKLHVTAPGGDFYMTCDPS
jgi:hypothetical protein